MHENKNDLNDRGREVVLRAWEARVNETIEHPRLKRNVSYRGLMRMEAYKIQKHILDDAPYEPPPCSPRSIWTWASPPSPPSWRSDVSANQIGLIFYSVFQSYRF